MTQLRTIAILIPLSLVMLPFGKANAGEILENPPRKPDPDARYVFYLHGQIVQDVGPRPTHPQYGLYDYPLILETLAGHALTVISQRRKQGTDRQKYAKTIVKQVGALLDRGVEPEKITVLGFSAGGIITIFASSMMPDAEINFVIMICWHSGTHRSLPQNQRNSELRSPTRSRWISQAPPSLLR